MGSRVIPAETSRSEGVPGVVPMGWKLEARVWRLGSNPSHSHYDQNIMAWKGPQDP